MTINSYPYLGTDKTYAEQRKQRLQDCVDDYLQDDEVSPLTLYNDLQDCLNDVIDYHKKSMDKASGTMSLIKGHRPIDFISPDEC